MTEEVLNQQEVDALSQRVVDEITPAIANGLQGLIAVVERDKALIDQLIAHMHSGKGLPVDVEAVQVRQLFVNMVQLRQLFTGQIYQLWVGMEDGTTVQTTIDALLASENGIMIKDNQIEYNLSAVQTDLNFASQYQTQLQELNKKLFPKNGFASDLPFLYQHHRGGKPEKGQFYNLGSHIAQLQSGASQARSFYYYAYTLQKRGFVYNSKTAMNYNKGHVYEWFLDDINKKGEPPADVHAFMRSHKRDSIRFLQGGDIRSVDAEKGIIYAVQIKKINNRKLISYTQIQKRLEILLRLKDIAPTRQGIAKIIKQAFLTRKGGINKNAYTKVDEVVDTLFAQYAKR